MLRITQEVPVVHILHNCALLISDLVHQVLFRALQQKGEIGIFIP